MGRGALDDLPRPGPDRTSGPEERARLLQEARRTPDRKEDATATWSLTLLQRGLRQTSDGLPGASTFTILHPLHEAGYRWQKDRTWCHTGRTLKKGRDGGSPSFRGKMDEVMVLWHPHHAQSHSGQSHPSPQRTESRDGSVSQSEDP
jgi:hypothetical protein